MSSPPSRSRFLSKGALLGVLMLATSGCSSGLIALHNDQVQRVLRFDGQVWRTVQFARADGSDQLDVDSDELGILLLDDTELTLDQYRVAGAPWVERRGPDRRVSIRYVPRPGVRLPPGAPAGITIEYAIGGEPAVRKIVRLDLREGQAIDRLEVERFSVKRPARRGGRGEPVFVGPSWFFGVEYPAFYARHTDGNTPAAYTGPYDRLGNYSFIDLAGRDVDRHPRAGLVRLMHFPGYARRLPDGGWGIVGQTSIAGVGRRGDSAELAFLDYLDRVRRPVRSFVHYNNWYDGDGKRLSIENFVGGTYGTFKENLDRYGVRIDAMVPDDGWQNRRSVYEPNPAQFPRGLDDLAALGQALRDGGTGLGLWIALDGYNSDIDWGVAHGFAEAQRNPHFSRFKRYYTLTDPAYDGQLRQRLGELIVRGGLRYLKHDFNELCDLGAGHGHLPTDRHGHEASVDATIDLLAWERAQNPDIYQNITNWIWFSPFWLMHGNNLWMLANDTGEFRDWPELSTLVMSAAYRDVHLYRAWHDPETRPLIPISHLMTHGIIYTKTKYAGLGDTVRDFADAVMLYYARGVQLKEWYINPRLLSPAQWEVLGRATRWAQENTATLANAVMVGGDPKVGEPYGYVAWRGERGILSVRNPGPAAAEIVVPFDQRVWFRGAAGRSYQARVIYPYQAPWPASFRAGEPMRVQVPGYSLLVMQLAPGEGGGAAKLPALDVVAGRTSTVTLPDEEMQRCELLVIARGASPAVRLDGAVATPARTSAGHGWRLESFELRAWRGRKLAISLDGGDGAEAWLVLDRPVADPPANADPRLPAPVAQAYRRQTVRLDADGTLAP